MTVKLTWHGHATWSIDADGAQIVVDARGTTARLIGSGVSDDVVADLERMSQGYNQIRGTLKTFGILIKGIAGVGFEKRVQEIIDEGGTLADPLRAQLDVLRAVKKQIAGSVAGFDL